MDVGVLSEGVLGHFDVEVTVSRSGEDDRTENVVLWLGVEEWHTHGGTKRRVALDKMSALHSVDIEPADTITCSDTKVVPTSTTWTVADRLVSDADRFTNCWRIVEQKDAE